MASAAEAVQALSPVAERRNVTSFRSLSASVAAGVADTSLRPIPGGSATVDCHTISQPSFEATLGPMRYAASVFAAVSAMRCWAAPAVSSAVTTGAVTGEAPRVVATDAVATEVARMVENSVEGVIVENVIVGFRRAVPGAVAAGLEREAPEGRGVSPPSAVSVKRTERAESDEVGPQSHG